MIETERCIWREDTEGWAWPSCTEDPNGWDYGSVVDGSPAWNFCPYCGVPIEVKGYEEKEDTPLTATKARP
jgi:hypothetical protein